MPYFYLYDTFTSERAHAGTLVRIENALTDLGIQGRVGRLTILKSAKDLIDSAIKDGADTVVAVGQRILGKADDEAHARRYLNLLSGRSHRVIPSVRTILDLSSKSIYSLS